MTAMSGLGRASQDPRRCGLDFSPLQHPTWWLALLLLLVNDNLLKGEGLVPTWLTGKLSDFAFLVVAPALLAVFVPVCRPARRVVACGLVGGLIVGVNLSPALSHAVVAGATQVGLVWRLWPDPTDLLALLVLPWTWRLLAVASSTPPRRPLRACAAIALGAFACLATSAPHGPIISPMLVNRTARTVNVELTWLLRKPPCTAGSAATLATTLAAGDIGESEVVPLGSQQSRPLGGPPSAAFSSVGRCSTVLVAVENGPAALVVAWERELIEGDGAFIQCSAARGGRDAPDSRSNAVFLVERDGHLRLEADAGIELIDISLDMIAARGTAPGSCRGLRDQYRTRAASASACVDDDDCRAVRALPAFGEPCVAYVNPEAEPAFFYDLIQQWLTQCLSDETECRGVRPPRCQAGRCQEACAGAELPLCPEDCPYGEKVLEGTRCHSSCQTASGQLCACVDNAARCAPAPLPVADCPLSCVPDERLPLPDAGPRPDAGSEDAAAAAPEATDAEPGETASQR